MNVKQKHKKTNEEIEKIISIITIGRKLNSLIYIEIKPNTT